MPPRSSIRKLGAPVRKVLGKGAALIPSSKKRGGPGVALDIPLGHKDAAFVRSHFDGMEVRVADAPRANEIVVAVAVTDSRPPAAARRRLAEARDQGRGRAALSRAKTSPNNPRGNAITDSMKSAPAISGHHAPRLPESCASR